MGKGGSWFDYADQQRPPMWQRWGVASLFRSADLNLLGWLAVFGPGVVAGLGLAFALGRAWPPLAVIGALSSLLMAVALDRRAWRRITTGIGTELPQPRAEAVVERLRARGVEVTLEEQDHQDGEVSLSFQSTNRFLSVIHSEVAAEWDDASGA